LLLCGLGLPIPEDISLIAAGYFSWRGALHISKAFAVCFVAVLAGDSLAFFLGRYFGRRVLASQLARKYFTHRRQLKVRAYFRKFGSKVVLVGRFTPGLRFTIFFTAGTLHLRPPVFLIYDFSGPAFTSRCWSTRPGSSAGRSTTWSVTPAAPSTASWWRSPSPWRSSSFAPGAATSGSS